MPIRTDIKGDLKIMFKKLRIVEKKCARDKKSPLFLTKCHCQLFIQVLQVNKPEERQELELLK
jgi:hypothetical protein